MKSFGINENAHKVVYDSLIVCGFALDVTT